jgi:hypothetical protein
MNTKKTLALVTALIALSGFFALPQISVYAEGGADTPRVKIEIPNPIGRHGDTIPALFRAIVDNIILPIGGVLAVLAFIYSGFLYVTAQGNETKIATAHRALLYTAIGTAILLGAWVISSVIENTINSLRS